MRILALDLGKYKTVACEYEAETGSQGKYWLWLKSRFGTVIEMTKSSRVNLRANLVA